MTFRFENPQAFQYLWVIPLVLIIGYWYERRNKNKIKNQIGSRLYPFLSSSVSLTKRQIKLALQMLALMFFIVALARPQGGQSLQKVKSEGVEIIFAVDVSESMLAEDV